MIPAYKPYLPPRALEYAHEALASGDLAQGGYKKIAAEHLAALLGIKHVILTCNGTAATHLIFKALKFRHPQIERVIFPNNVYVAAWNAALFDEHDWDLIALDADLRTWNAAYETAEQFAPMDETTAFVIVHNIGNPVNVPALKRKFPRCVFVEDNCEGLFGRYEQSHTGTASLCASLSFYGNKTITCGEGGAFITNDTELYEWINRVHSQGQTEKKFIHDVVAYNYRMSNLQAAILVGQLSVISEILHRKSFIFNLYRLYLSRAKKIQFQVTEPDVEHSRWMFGVRIGGTESYDAAAQWFAQRDIETRPIFYPITDHKHLSRFHPTATGNARRLSNECVILPSYPSLNGDEIEYICDRVREFSE